MKIFAAGIATETNTFSPLVTGLEDFLVHRGTDARERHRGHSALDLHHIWGHRAKEHGYDFVIGLMAFAQPSGVTLRAAYESLREELLSRLRMAMPVDVVLLMLHGAMVAQGCEDCEEDIIRCVRKLVGPQAVIGVELDLHCHLSEQKIAAADIVVTYKEYPHTDVNERATELYDLAVQTKLGMIRPTMSLFDCQMVGLYPTTRQPMRSFVDALKGAEGRGGLLSVSLGHGFQFADLPSVGTKVLVVTDSDPSLATRSAREFGLRIYDLRRDIGFHTLSLTMEEALSRALSSPRTPVVVADQSDNTGGGAPGDATFALRWLLDHGAKDLAMAIFYDPEVVRIARKAGLGSKLLVRLGGKMGTTSGSPVDIEVTVHRVLDDYMHALPQKSGEPWLFRAGDVVALRSETLDIVVSSERCQCFGQSIFNDLGVDLKAKRIVIPKSCQHFYEGFTALSENILYMVAPGAVPPDPRRIAYRRLDTSRLYPWNDDPLAAERLRST